MVRTPEPLYWKSSHSPHPQSTLNQVLLLVLNFLLELVFVALVKKLELYLFIYCLSFLLSCFSGSPDTALTVDVTYCKANNTQEGPG
jgi:hypothetical protein